MFGVRKYMESFANHPSLPYGQTCHNHLKNMRVNEVILRTANLLSENYNNLQCAHLSYMVHILIKKIMTVEGSYNFYSGQ